MRSLDLENRTSVRVKIILETSPNCLPYMLETDIVLLVRKYRIEIGANNEEVFGKFPNRNERRMGKRRKIRSRITRDNEINYCALIRFHNFPRFFHRQESEGLSNER